MIIKYFIIFLSVLLTACVSKVEPEPFIIKNQKFASATGDEGDKLFSFLVSIKPTSSEFIKFDKDMTRSQYKKMMSRDVFDDSPELKMQLEDEAVLLLEKELKVQKYCQAQHTIEEVLWREYSVRLSGRCVK
ncbi:hypothetical protein PULV_a3236 [Pseudoalteromonas ulvae UL12]|uniref:Lipoprotein n=1 Tax=Pseudoalteromonas ulvae TaxID=107327 RepID=A0A244CPK7_PSEDV|nr:hypothetical protein [Pseudoalteromonas ulvae]MBE0364943.1 hypothetical protein [Pseudoalteromonas ulvae UL12]OUL57508.1 hypothetical protein B1199_10570 [Pseudoalteromonas ulvae]